MMPKPAFVVLLSLLLVACTVKEKYIVLSEVPTSPTVTVIPSTGAKEDVADADVVMGLLVDCGVRTVLRPVMMKERTEYNDAGSASGIGVSGGRIAVAMGDAASKGGLTTSVDEVSLLKETNADYVFYVRHKPGGPQMVLVKREDGQVLHVGQIDLTGEGAAAGCCLLGSTYQREATATPQQKMRELLSAAGIVK
jgi:hypothetical protein